MKQLLLMFQECDAIDDIRYLPAGSDLYFGNINIGILIKTIVNQNNNLGVYMYVYDTYINDIISIFNDGGY
jgi:hypothetical protein